MKWADFNKYIRDKERNDQLFNIMAILITLSVLFGNLNYRFIMLPTSTLCVGRLPALRTSLHLLLLFHIQLHINYKCRMAPRQRRNRYRFAGKGIDLFCENP